MVSKTRDDDDDDDDDTDISTTVVECLISLSLDFISLLI